MMSEKSKLKKSRANWKEKAVKKGENERYLIKENKRIKKERDKYKDDLKRLKNQEKVGAIQNISTISDKETLVYITLQLFLIARISFRGISRVLSVIGSYLGLSKTPCVQTIINWVTRLSISRMKKISHKITESSRDFICVIDISIGLGAGKILAVLLLDTRHHLLNKGAPMLENVHCVGVSVADTWTGETIADFLEKVIVVGGQPVSYLKDGGTELGKAARLLNDRGYSSVCIDDVSHVIANLLKHEYQEHPMFETFISACGKVSKKFKQSVLGCLVPPKVSTKARFMNFHRLVKWAEQLLKHSPKGGVPKDSLISKLRKAFDKLPECKTFISKFLRDADSLLKCQKVLKTKGLSQDTYNECQDLVKTIPERSAVRIGFENWMKKELSIAIKLGLGKIGMPISSDCIESLFGVAKHHGTGEIKDANGIALRLPTFCGELTPEDAKNVLNISVKEQQNLTQSLPSLVKQRRKVLSNPGSLEDIQLCDTQKNIELIPESKKRVKNPLIHVISDSCHKIDVPFIALKKQNESFVEIETIEVAA